MKNIGDDILICPHCGAVLDRHTLYSVDCICIDCGTFIDIEEMEEMLMYGEDYYNDYWRDYNYDRDDYYLEYMKRRSASDMKGSENMLPALKNQEQTSIFDADIDEDDDVISTFVIRFITTADYNTIKTSFEQLEAQIDSLELETNGKIREYLETAGGQKLAKGLNIKLEDIDEYKITAAFILGEGEASKRTLISTLCQAFPLCFIREEESSYIMANNKGLAKGLVDLTNEDQIEMLSLFLTGFEKYKILCHFLYWVPPYRSKQAKDIMVKWDNNALISLEALRKPDSVPAIWQEYLASLSSVLVSADAKDNGETLTFETMLEDIIDEELEKKDAKIDRDNIIQVVSLRGTGDYCLGAEDEDAEAAK